MPVKESRCFVLKTYRAGESDRVAVLFSGDEGRVRAYANGARRPKSRLQSLDVGNEVVAGWFEREGRELVTVDRSELAVSSLPLARDPALSAALAWMLDMADVVALDREANPRLYRLIAACRDALLHGRPPLLVITYFEAWSLRLAGLYPRPGACECGDDFAGGGAMFYASGPAYRCQECGPRYGSPTAPLPPGALRVLGDVWTQAPGNVDAGPGEVLDLFRFHGAFLPAAADRPVPARRAFEAMWDASDVG